MLGQHDKLVKSTGKRGEFFLEIHVVDNNVEKAIRVLKRKLQQEGLFREMKQRKFYEKPSVKKKRKEKEAQRRTAEKNAHDETGLISPISQGQKFSGAGVNTGPFFVFQPSYCFNPSKGESHRGSRRLKNSGAQRTTGS